jgi:ketosteroid isomerase-like protein
MDTKGRVAVLAEAYKVWNDTKGARNPFLDLLAETVRWRSLADGVPAIEFAKPGSTKDDVRRYFEKLGEDWAMNHFVVDRFVAEGDDVVAMSRVSWTNRHTGKTAESLKVDMIRYEGDRIVEVTEFYDTAAALAAATP